MDEKMKKFKHSLAILLLLLGSTWATAQEEITVKVASDRAAVVNVVSNDENLRDRRQMYKIFQNVATKLMAGVNLPALPTQVAQAAERRNVPTDALTFLASGKLSAAKLRIRSCPERCP